MTTLNAISFFDQLSAHCGKAFAGSLVSNAADDVEMAGAGLIIHVRSCTDSEIRVPFHVGRIDGNWDRSRTWVITRTSNGLRLEHEHRHEDGSLDKVNLYGGNAVSLATAQRQEFPVDRTSIVLFQNEGLARSVTNIWALEIVQRGADAGHFAYELRRNGENARFFRVEFDLSSAIVNPPSPWGGK